MNIFNKLVYTHFGFEENDITSSVKSQLRIRYFLLIINSILYYLMTFSLLGRLGLNIFTALISSTLVFLVVYNLFRQFSITTSGNKKIFTKIISIYFCIFLSLFFVLIFIPSLQYKSDILFIKSNKFTLYSIPKFWESLIWKKSNYLLIIAILIFLLLSFINITIVFGDTFFATKSIIKEQKTLSFTKQIQIFDSIQHELGNKIPALKNDLNDLKDYFKNPSRIELLKDPIRSLLPGENQSEISTVEELIHRMERKLSYSIASIDSLGSIIKANPSSFKPELLNLHSYLLNEIEKVNYSKDLVTINIEGDKKISQNIDPIQFSFLVQNFISNAIRHGGFEKIDKKYFILIKIYLNGNYLILDFINNGRLLPPNYTINQFLQPYNHYGKTGNSGLGGYLIDIVVKSHNGKIEIVDITKDNNEFKVCFRLTFNRI
jgi:signal transduction histidine kinase